jgi:hypothetical protein
VPYSVAKFLSTHLGLAECSFRVRRHRKSPNW